MPNYNGAKYLARSIDAFLEQDYTNKELIIVDGKSTDDSHEIIKSYTEKYKEIIWLKQEDKGISHAYNMAIDVAKGEVLGYLGSDDLLYKDTFAEIAYANRLCNFDAIYFNSYTYYIQERKCIYRRSPTTEFNKQQLLELGTIAPWQNIFFKRYIFDKYRFDETNKTCMDYEFYLRIADEEYLYHYVDKPSSVNIFDGNISMQAAGRQFEEACNVTMKYKGEYNGPMYFFPPKKKSFLKRGLKKILQQINE